MLKEKNIRFSLERQIFLSRNRMEFHRIIFRIKLGFKNDGKVDLFIIING